MNKVKRLLLLTAVMGLSITTYSQSLDDSGISAGFFDSSEESSLNFSSFHLPPLSVLLNLSSWLRLRLPNKKGTSFLISAHMPATVMVRPMYMDR